ncbi:MAG: MATE family efflux transporter [Firmicutes bacterium]|nr:MATE family efflux transporter [Bacillota bacterium]
MADNNSRSERQNRMGTAPILPLIIKMSLPSVFSMLILALYNIVDSIYVSRIGESALSAVSLIFPLQQLSIAVSVGTAVGLASLISRRLGEQNVEAADKAATHGVFLAFCSWLVFVVVGIFGVPAFANAFSDNPALISPAVTYGRIVLIGCFFAMCATSTERIMQGCGDMISPMICSLSGCITNIILDPIMIFGYLGCPALGVAGAAYATVIGQVVGMCMAFWMLRHKNFPVQFEFKGFRPDMKTIRDIYAVGLPSIVMQSINSVTTICLNAILISFSETAVAVLGVYFKLQSFVFMPVFGMNQGVMPIMGYNFGARNKERLMETFKKAMFLAFGIMLTGCLLFQLLPSFFMGLFNAQGEMMRLGTRALRIVSLSFPFVAFSMIPGTLFQATAHGINSLIVTLLRQIVVLIPVAFILSRIFGLDGIWYAYPTAEIMSVTAAQIMLRKLIKTEIETL